MIRITLLPVLLISPLLTEPSGTVMDGPPSIRSFRPISTEQDDALETYFTDAGPLAIEFYEHLTLLSNPWLAGRQPGTDGSQIAGDYVVWNFQQSGLDPAFDNGDTWFQPFDFELSRSTPTVVNEFVSVDDMAFTPERDYVVLGNSGSGNVTGKITFVGYAIESGEEGYSSFNTDTDLTGQIAMMLRYEPLDEKGASQWAGRRFSPHASMRDKMQSVTDRGAIGVILVNPPNCRDGRRGLESVLSSRFGSTNVPVVQFTEKTANLAILGYDIAKLQRDADAGTITTKSLNSKATLNIEVESSAIHAQNIGGVLQGRGDLADEWIVVGGHYDHLGFGYVGTQHSGELHLGADDNASGTAVVMMMARLLSEQYASSEDDSLRSILFILFDAEEAGLHGSAAFIEHPIMDLDSVNAMINLDMVGNLSENNISLSGSGTAEEFGELIPSVVEASSLTASLTPGGTGPSDHTNFYQKDIPVLFFFTGITDEYHTPKDFAHTTNPAGAAKIVELAHAFASRMVDDPKLTFATNTSGGSNRSARRSSPVRLGIHPSYTADLETGVLITGVSEGTSAEDAGLGQGDVLLAWNDEELTGGRKLMDMLQASKPGDVVELTVQRNGKNIIVTVTLKAP